ncbi:MAG: 2-oxoglutarate translocator [Clostridia bacterium]|nr:2-oxoglutarate translocator [Clostridia bacterium]
MPCVRLLGVFLLAMGMALLFLCVPGWAWAALTGASLVACGLFLATSGTW